MKTKLKFIVSVFAVFFSSLTSAVDLTVDSVADTADAVLDGVCDDGTGQCTYRAAIQEANNVAGPDTISFNIPPGACDAGTSVCTIAVLTPLPDITDPLTIDGSTQPGNADVCTTDIPNRPPYLVVLDGGGVFSPGVRFHAEPGFIGATGSTVRGLNIRGFSDGVAISGVNGSPITGVTVECNFIGTDETGSAIATPPNSLRGVIIACDADDHTVGGTNPAAGNLISGNDVGVWVYCDNLGDGGTGNSILGNFIGTDKTASIALGNAGAGVAVTGDAGPNGNVIGGTADGATIHGNVIGGHIADGVWIDGTATTNNLVVGNFIGTDPTGRISLGNGWDGLYIHAPGNTIGGPGEMANTIAFNGSAGGIVVFEDGAAMATANRIQQNSIYENIGLGIDLGDDGPTANDPGDVDSGANMLQNYPVISSVAENGPNLEIEYSVDSPDPLTVDFYLAGDGCQARWFLGDDTSAGGGGIQVAVIPAGGATADRAIVASATDASGNTSEFSDPTAACGPFFDDGFESGDTTAWSSATP